MLPKNPMEFLKPFFEEQIPFHRLLGMQLDSLSDGQARMQVPFRDEFIGDPFRPALHGGIISALMDTCGGAAVLTTLHDVDDRTSTVDLRINYLRPGRKETLISDAEIVRAGNRVAVVSLIAYHPGEKDKPVATGTGVYNVRRTKEV